MQILLIFTLLQIKWINSCLWRYCGVGVRFIAAQEIWHFPVLQLSDRRSSKSVLGSPSVAAAVDLALVPFPPVPVSGLLRGPRAVTDCADTHHSAANEGEGGDERHGQRDRERAWHAKDGIKSVLLSPGCQSFSQPLGSP